MASISKNKILKGMQISFMNSSDAINSSSSGRVTITYQFATTSEPTDMPGSGQGFTGYEAFTNAEKAAFRDALDHIESFLNVEFVEVTGSNDPDLNVGKADVQGPFPGTIGFGGPSILTSGSTIVEWDGFVVYDKQLDLSAPEQFNLLLHEVGHALGLDHPFEGVLLPDKFDNNKYTVMSYTNNPETNDVNDAMGLFDVLALQDIWGAAKKNKNDDVYQGARKVDVDTVHDTGGKDEFKAKKSHGKVDIDLREGEFSSFGDRDDVAIAYGTEIENATGGNKNDKITGNDLKNKIKGNGGKDKIKANGGNDNVLAGKGNDNASGGTGKDTLNGQEGNDTLNGNGGADTFEFEKGGGSDVIGDFQNDTDVLHIIGHGSKSKVMKKAKKSGDDVLFEFNNGDTILVENITKSELSDDVITS